MCTSTSAGGCRTASCVRRGSPSTATSPRICWSSAPGRPNSLQQRNRFATSARALLTLLTKIASAQAVDATASDEMVGVLKRQKFHDRIPAGLPRGTVVAHKTGEIAKIQHDAAIVFGDRPFVLVVLVRGLQEAKAGAALIADIARILYVQTRVQRN